MGSGSVQHCLPLLRILNHTDGPSEALQCSVFVQLKITDKSEGSCFKLTTFYFVVVIILSRLHGVVTQHVLFVIVLRLLL